MSNINNLQLILNDRFSMDFRNPEDLSIRLNRIADDLREPSKAFGDFSYSFTLPFTKNNNRVFGNINEFDIQNKFVGKTFTAKVILNDDSLLEGELVVNEVLQSGYKCVLYSAFKELADQIKDRDLVDLQFDNVDWNFENTINNYNNRNSNETITSDNSDICFPFIFYNTEFAEKSIISGVTGSNIDAELINLDPLYKLTTFYHMYQQTGTSKINGLFFHQVPPAVFVKNTLKQIFKDAGFGLSSSLFDDRTFKNLITPFTGDDSAFDYGNGLITTQDFKGNEFKATSNSTEFKIEISRRVQFPNLEYDPNDNFQETTTWEYTFPNAGFGRFLCTFFYRTEDSQTGSAGVLRLTSSVDGNIAFATLTESFGVTQVTVDSGLRTWQSGEKVYMQVTDLDNTGVIYVQPSTSFTNILQPRKGQGDIFLRPSYFLPQMSQSDFVSGILNMFNAYLIVDNKNKTVQLEPYTALFGNTQNPYDITKKVFADTVDVRRSELESVSLKYRDDDDFNKTILSVDRFGRLPLQTTSPVYDKYGTIDNNEYHSKNRGQAEIQFPFAPTNMLKMAFITNTNFSASISPQAPDTQADYIEMLIPSITKQTVNDDEDTDFYSSSGDTKIDNNPDRYTYAAQPRILIYNPEVSSSTYSPKFIGGVDDAERKDFYYLNMITNVNYNDGGISINKTRIRFASFLGLPSEFLTDAALTKATNDYTGVSGSINLPDYFNSHYIAEYLKTVGDDNPRDSFSLSASENKTTNTLYNVFHLPKYQALSQNEVIEADMRMNDQDWKEMQINRIITYDQQTYRIISIKNYDVIKRTAKIELNRIL